METSDIKLTLIQSLLAAGYEVDDALKSSKQIFDWIMSKDGPEPKSLTKEGIEKEMKQQFENK